MLSALLNHQKQAARKIVAYSPTYDRKIDSNILILRQKLRKAKPNFYTAYSQKYTLLKLIIILICSKFLSINNF
jgi:hypothetical protein